MGIHLNENHWCLLIADYLKREVGICDSIGRNNTDAVYKLLIVYTVDNMWYLY